MATHAALAVEATWQAMAADIDAAPARDIFERAAAIKERTHTFDFLPEVADPEEHRRAANWLRRRLIASLEATSLDGAEGLARAGVTIETLVSLNETRQRLREDFPGLRPQIDAIVARLGLTAQERRRVRHHLVFEHYGDLGVGARKPHLHDAFFRLVLGDEPVLGERAARLYRGLLDVLAGYVDYVLWYHLWKRDAGLARELFARNDPAEVEAALRALLADDDAYERLLADHDPRHAGRMKLVVGRYSNLGMDHLRRLAKGFRVARWVDLAGGLSSYYLDALLGLEGTPALCVDAAETDESALEHVLPLEFEALKGVWLMDDAEIEAYADRIRKSPIERRVANLLHLDETRRAVPPIDRPTLYTCGGSYLGSIRPEDEAVRSEAIRRGVSGPRVGAMQMADTILALGRPGDLISFFGRAGVPYFRGVTWLTLAVSRTFRPVVRIAGYRSTYPLRREHWEIV
jgi:hypothetical protein